VWQSEHSNIYRWNNFHGNTTNLRGLLLTELPGGELSQNARLVQGLVIVSSLTVLGIVGWTWLRLKSFASPEGELAFALNLVAALLVSYHAFVQDMSLLFMAILCAECSFLQPSLSGMARWVVFCQRRFSVQTSIPVCVFRDTVNSFSAAALRHVCSVFPQLFHIICEKEWNHTNSMTCEIFLAHGLETGLADVSSRSLILMADLWGPGLGQSRRVRNGLSSLET